MQNRSYACYFPTEHAAKDFGIAYSLGREAGLVLAVAKAAHKQFDLIA